MATHYANGKTTTSGLVFMYDTIDKENCYKGEPTTNLSGPDFTTWGIDASGYSATGTRTILSTYPCRIEDSNTNTRQSKWIYGLSGNTNYTFSVKFKKISGAPTLRFQIQPHNGGTYILSYFPTTIDLGIVDQDGWQTAIYSITTPAGTDRVIWFIQDGNDYTGYTHSFELKDVQLEQKSHVTPFTSDTRSSTQALKDLTNTTEIDLSNVSFDANAQMLWDGTDDTMAIADYTTHKPGQPFSYEIVFKPLGSGTSYDKMLIGKPGWHTGIMYQYSYIWFRTRYGSPAFYDTGTVNVIQGNYYHVVATYTSGTSMKLYVNGVLVADNNSIPSALVDIGNTLNIGGSSVNYSSYVEIPAAKTYNRALTQTEITQNYNSYKSRFNLA
jgi:hypothetical protein